jgi:hypothetical protein
MLPCGELAVGEALPPRRSQGTPAIDIAEWPRCKQVAVLDDLLPPLQHTESLANVHSGEP